MAWWLLVVTVVAAGLAVSHGSPTNPDPPQNGAFECPCLNSSSPAAALISAELQALNYPADYGLSGCQAYDLNQPHQGCNVANPPSYCDSPWCYVDMEKCPVHLERCIAAGGVFGSDRSPYCRQREHAQSVVLSTNIAYYSYASCGSLDTFGPALIKSQAQNRHMRLAVSFDAYPPWTVRTQTVDPARPQWKGLTGVLPTLLESMKVEFSFNISLRDYFASAQSKQKFPGSSFTACVMDVKVGKLDACIGNFWVTPERLAISSFSQPFGQDRMYLVAPKEPVPDGFLDYLAKPWQPFSPELWGLVIGYITFTGMVTAWLEPEGEDYENPNAIPRFFKALYITWFGVFSGGPQNAASTLPARFSQLAYGLFIIIVLASYTANLATILVAEATSNGINSIDDAIATQLTICCLSAIQTELQVKYPTAKFRGFDIDHRIFRELHKGTCGAAVMSEESMDYGFSGDSNIWDCSEVDSNSVSGFEGEGFSVTAESACARDSSGSPSLNRDCNAYQKVGDIITSISLAMPVSPDYIKTFSYAIREAQSSGKFDQMMQQFEDSVAPYACSTAKRRSLNGLPEEPGRRKGGGGGGGGGTAAVAASASGASTDSTKSLGLPWTSMIGVFCISVFLQLVALLLWAIERCVGMSFSEMCGCGHVSENTSDPEYEDRPVPPHEHPRYDSQIQTPRLATAVDVIGRSYSPVAVEYSNQMFARLPHYDEWSRGETGGRGYTAQDTTRPPKRPLDQEQSLSPLPAVLAARMPMTSATERGKVSGDKFGEGSEEGFRECKGARTIGGVTGVNFGNRPEYESPDQPNGLLNDIQTALWQLLDRQRAHEQSMLQSHREIKQILSREQSKTLADSSSTREQTSS